MRQLAAALCVLMLVVLVGFSQEKPQEKEKKETPAPRTYEAFVIPADEAKRENPVKPTEASLAEGKKLYGYQCAMCHGEKGDGKGDLVETMKLKTRDWTSADSLKDLTDGSMYYIIEKGKGQMPSQEGRMSTHQKWNLINYIRSFAKKSGETPKPAVPPKPE